MKIVFYHDGISFDGQSIYHSSLGGTESALIYLARALQSRGTDVSIYCHCSDYKLIDEIEYIPLQTLGHAELDCDVFISVRSLTPFVLKRWAKLQVLWSPDSVDQPFLNQLFSMPVQTKREEFSIGLYNLKDIQQHIDHLFLVSEWQRKSFISTFEIAREKCSILPNGVWWEDYKNYSPLSQRSKQLIYTSTPFRGLDKLLAYFPQIKKKVPEANLLVLSGMQLYGASDLEDQNQYQAIYDLANQEGVELLKPLPKNEMIEYLNQSRVLAYPNTFDETFCIAALEAHAAGLPIVTTKSAALIERVEHEQNGYLISDVESEGYQSQFVDHIVELLTDDVQWERMSQSARASAANYDYQMLAQNFLENLSFLLKKNLGTDPVDFESTLDDIRLNIQRGTKKYNIKVERGYQVEHLNKIKNYLGLASSRAS